MNPYQTLSGQWAAALFSGANPLPINASNLNTQISNSLIQTYLPSVLPQPPSADLVIFANTQLNSLANAMANDYQTGSLYTSNIFSGTQNTLAMELLDGVCKVPLNLISSFIGAMESQIASAILSDVQKAPLYFGTMVGARAFIQWNAALQSIPIGAPWTSFFETQTGLTPNPDNLSKIPILVQAAIDGAYIGYLNFMKQNFGNAPDKMNLCCLLGSTLINDGKVFYNWLPVHPVINGIDPSTASNMAYTYAQGQKNGSGNPK